MHLLVKLLIRMLSGERFRKAKPVERQWGGGFLVFLPIFMFSFLHLGDSFLERASPVGVWLFAMSCMLVLGMCLFLWVQYIPAKPAIILGVIIWAATFWMLLTGKFI